MRYVSIGIFVLIGLSFLIPEQIRVENKTKSSPFEIEVFFFDLPRNESYIPTYNAKVLVANHTKHELSRVIMGSTYPNASQFNSKASPYNTIISGEHIFNNRTGHAKSRRKGLNVVTSVGMKKGDGRFNLGISPSGDTILMEYVNVHAGKSNLGNYNSRGSHGCLTIQPKDSIHFFKAFEFNGSSGTIGNSEGGLYVFREDSITTEQIISALKSEFNVL